MNLSLSISSKTLGKPKNGFAMVVTLILMVMLSILAIGMLSLSSVAIRTSGTNRHRAEAEANARLALMMAIGELQKEIGPDRRVTSAANVLDARIETPESDGIANPQWLGAWNSWTKELNASGIQDTYTKGRSASFRRWLVSSPNPSGMDGIKDAAESGPNRISVVAGGAVGVSALPDLHVQVPKVGIRDGAFAWWVGGENQKARVAGSAEPVTESGRIAQRSAWPGSGHRELEGLSGLPLGNESIAKAITLPMLGASQDSDAVRERLQGHFHDLTTVSVGLLANVRKGGLKKDLNLLLENKKLPPEFGDFSREKQNGSIVSIRDKELEVPSAIHSQLNPNFSSWYKLHQYYTLYKGGGDEAAQDSIPLPFKRGVWGDSGPNANFHWDAGNFDQLGWARTPILSRLMMVFSVRRVASRTPGRYDYKLGVNPVVVIWNPYNVTLHSGRLMIEIGPGAIEYKAYVNDTQSFDWRRIRLSQRADDKGDFKVRVYPMEGPGPSFHEKPIVLKPGESRIYSAKSGFVQADNQYHVELYPGYQPPEADGGFDVPLSGLTNLSGDSRVELAMRLSDARSENNGVHQLYYVARNAQTVDQQRYSEMAASPIREGKPMPIVEDAPGKRVVFPNSNERVAFASVKMVMKSGEDLRNPGSYANEDHRNRNFIHANPVNQRAAFGEATDRMKGMAQYQLHVEQATGNELTPDFDPATNRAYLGSAISLGNSTWPGQPSVVVSELPAVPVTSIASLMHFKLNPGVTSGATDQHLWDVSANQALGIGNSFAHPLLPGDAVYQDVPDLAARGGSQWLEFKLSRDAYDHAFLNNDALWDDWFCSTITEQSRGVFAGNRSLGDLVEDFVRNDKPLPNPHLRVWPGSLGTAELVNVFANGDEPDADAWREASGHLVLDGAFNVNSTSVDAWRTLFNGLREESILYLDPDTGGVREASVAEDEVVFSRFSLPCSPAEGANAGDPAAWLGIRSLTPGQIDKLAAECVRQVKLRGPFLNLSDFVNRRLVDGEEGVCGALQAAIDWDEFGGNSPDSSSINGRFKSGDDFIPTNAVGGWNLPFPAAAAGSRFAGIPGYLTQADVLKRIGNMITPRDDTFRIRAYGESRGKDGKPLSRVWCEAVVQRVPEYLDPLDKPGTAAADLTSSLNLAFGRQLKIVSFRWLSEQEI